MLLVQFPTLASNVQFILHYGCRL